MYHQVEGHKDLVRDIDSNAILNVNKNAYQAARERDIRIKKEKQSTKRSKKSTQKEIEKIETI